MDLSALIAQHWMMILFGAIIIIFLVIDLGFNYKSPKKTSFKSALWQSIFWIVISLLFGYLVFLYRDAEDGIKFFSAYLMEKSLSVDNIFIFLLILTFFNIEDKYYHKVLYYGIIGAIIFRAIFISVGVVLIHKFEWALYIFGIILIYTGIKMFFMKKDHKFNPNKSTAYRIMKKYLRFAKEEKSDQFYLKIDGKIYFTTLFLVLVLIETSDIIFALDSIPAVFAISQDPFIIFTSNIFAVMGLRAMFFLLIGILDKFRYLQKGISFILVFIGVKMLMELVDYKLPTSFSLYIIILMLGCSILLSVFIPDKKKRKTGED